MWKVGELTSWQTPALTAKIVSLMEKKKLVFKITCFKCFCEFKSSLKILNFPLLLQK